jgi:hypothetical protein
MVQYPNEHIPHTKPDGGDLQIGERDRARELHEVVITPGLLEHWRQFQNLDLRCVAAAIQLGSGAVEWFS